jgi:putative transcriptional regulator
LRGRDVAPFVGHDEGVTSGGPFTTGSLLVATPVLVDPNFARSVVLVVDHDEEGAVGLVLNRPTSLEVSSILPVWAELANSPQVVFEGGPVGSDSALALALLRGSAAEEETGHGGVGMRHLTSDLCLLDLDTDPDDVLPRLEGLRVFAGYAGWAPEQLEDEIDEGSWFVLPTAPGDVFAGQAATLWSDILRRQSGDLRLLATYPADPSLN